MNFENAANCGRDSCTLKKRTDIPRGVVALITVSGLVSLLLWSSVLGMSGHFGPGKGFVMLPVAKAEHYGH